MHIPDGFIDVQTSAIFAGLAAAGVATASGESERGDAGVGDG